MITVVFQALEYGQRFYKEDLHYREIGIATLTSYFVNANKDPKKGARLTPSDFFYFKPDNTNDINLDVGATFFSLVKDKLLPNWTAAIAPIKEFAALKTKGRVAKPRALISDEVQIIVICPLDLSSQIFCGFLLIFEVDKTIHPYVDVYDVDIPAKRYRLLLPRPEEGNLLTMSYSNFYLTKV